MRTTRTGPRSGPYLLPTFAILLPLGLVALKAYGARITISAAAQAAARASNSPQPVVPRRIEPRVEMT